MREIWFRGKHKNGYWEYGCLNYHRGDSLFDVCGDEIDSGDYYIRDCMEKVDTRLYGCNYKVIKETIGQYTGVRDKNGVAIFEGDIIRTKKYGRIRGHSNVNDFDCFAVQYIPCMFRLVNKHRGFNLVDDAFSEYEVIGNIHDNPELLEGGKT